MLEIYSQVLAVCFPNAHVGGVMGCIFFLTGFFFYYCYYYIFVSFRGWPLVNKTVSDVTHSSLHSKCNLCLAEERVKIRKLYWKF